MGIVCGDGRLATSRLLLTLRLPIVQGLLEGEEVVLLLPHHSVLDIKKKLRAFLSGRWTAKYEVIQVGDDNQPSLQGDGKQMKSVGDLDTASEGIVSDDQSFEDGLVPDKNYKDTTEISVQNNFDNGVLKYEQEGSIFHHQIYKDTIKESVNDHRTLKEGLLPFKDPIEVNVGDEQTFEKELVDPKNDSPKKETKQKFEENMIPIKIEENEQASFETITATNGLGKAIIKEENENKNIYTDRNLLNIGMLEYPKKIKARNSNTSIKNKELYFDKESNTWN